MHSRLPLAFAIILIAFNLRLVLTSVAPVLQEIMRDTGLSATGASVLTTLPVLCLGLFAPAGPWVARRLGSERTLVLLIAAITLGTALRGFGSIAALLIGGTLAGIGIGMGNVLVPGLLNRDFADHASLMTGAYTMTLCLGAAFAARFTAPLRDAFDGAWAQALAAWALPGALAMAVAAVVLTPRGTNRPAPMRPARGLWRDPVAWQITLYMSLQSALAYIVFGWLAPILRDRGDTAATAGAVVSVCILGQVAAALPAPLIAGRMRSQSLPAGGSLVVTGVSFLLLVLAPLEWQWLLAITLGLGMGASLALGVMLMVIRARDSHAAAGVSTMSQTVGYTLAAAGPLVVGALHDASGDWTGAAIAATVVCTGSAIAGWLAGRPRFVNAQG